jgi:hypothetical protein
MDDPLISMDKAEVEINRRLMDEKLAKSKEYVTVYIMPFEIMIGDYDALKLEQSK